MLLPLHHFFIISSSHLPTVVLKRRRQPDRPLATFPVTEAPRDPELLFSDLTSLLALARCQRPYIEHRLDECTSDLLQSPVTVKELFPFCNHIAIEHTPAPCLACIEYASLYCITHIVCNYSVPLEYLYPAPHQSPFQQRCDKKQTTMLSQEESTNLLPATDVVSLTSPLRPQLSSIPSYPCDMLSKGLLFQTGSRSGCTRYWTSVAHCPASCSTAVNRVFPTDASRPYVSWHRPARALSCSVSASMSTLWCRTRK